MKRRNFVQSLLLAPAAPVALTAQQPAPVPAVPARQFSRQPHNVPDLKVTQVDLTAETSQHFFTPEQFATLEKLGSVLVPPLGGNPGALDAKAPQFLDFLLSVSPAERQTLYQNGLDSLTAQARKQFDKPFAQLETTQADAILRPLMAIRLWEEDFPSDPLQSFIAHVHQDLRTATTNSREAAEAAAAAGHVFTRGRGTAGFYWKPIDPITEV
jgi:hypothetical protein